MAKKTVYVPAQEDLKLSQSKWSLHNNSRWFITKWYIWLEGYCWMEGEKFEGSSATFLSGIIIGVQGQKKNESFNFLNMNSI